MTCDVLHRAIPNFARSLHPNSAERLASLPFARACYPPPSGSGRSPAHTHTRVEKGKWKLAIWISKQGLRRANGSQRDLQLTTPLPLHNWHVYSLVYSVHTATLSERGCVCDLFKKETEHLYLRQPIHGIGRDPFRPFMREVSDGRFYFTASASS